MRLQRCRSAALLATMATMAMLAAMPVAGAEPAPTATNWPDFDAAFGALIDRIGTPVRLYDLEFDDDAELEFCVQDVDRPLHVDCWTWVDGKLTGPAPVKWTSEPDVDAIDHHVIDLREVDFNRLPRMLDDARTRTKLPDARLVRVALERGDSSGFLSYTDRPIWTFTIDTPRHDGHVEFDLDGKVLHAKKD